MKLEMVLVPIDFSDPSLKALRYAVAFAREFGGKLIVLSVVEPVASVEPEIRNEPVICCKLAAVEPRILESARPAPAGAQLAEVA